MKFFAHIFLALFLVTSCEKDEIKPYNNDDYYLMDELSVNNGFLFLTTQKVNLSITLQTTSNNPIVGAIIEVYNLDPQFEANKDYEVHLPEYTTTDLHENGDDDSNGLSS